MSKFVPVVTEHTWDEVHLQQEDFSTVQKIYHSWGYFVGIVKI